MARRPIVLPMYSEPPCDRKAALAEKDMMRQEHRDWEECRKINNRPGYQKLTKMKFNRG